MDKLTGKSPRRARVHLLVRLVVLSQRSLVRLLCTARFARALRFAHLLPSSWERGLCNMYMNAPTSCHFNLLWIGETRCKKSDYFTQIEGLNSLWSPPFLSRDSRIANTVYNFFQKFLFVYTRRYSLQFGSVDGLVSPSVCIALTSYCFVSSFRIAAAIQYNRG